jgi:hypothetical protein
MIRTSLLGSAMTSSLQLASGGQRNNTMIFSDGYTTVVNSYCDEIYRLVWWFNTDIRDNQQIINIANDSINSHDRPGAVIATLNDSTSLYDPRCSHGVPERKAFAKDIARKVVSIFKQQPNASTKH